MIRTARRLSATGKENRQSRLAQQLAVLLRSQSVASYKLTWLSVLPGLNENLTPAVAQP